MVSTIAASAIPCHISIWFWAVDGTKFAPTIQTPEAIHNVRLLFTLLPSAFVLVGGIFILRYPIHEKDAESVKEKLAERHARKEKAPIPQTGE